MKVNQHKNIDHAINNAQHAQSKALQNIAAQRAISGIDSSNLIIADNLHIQASSIEQGISNSNDAIGILQIADSALNNANNTANRIGELSARSNSASLSSRERDSIKHEINSLKDSIKDSLQNATFNGKNVFSGEANFETGNGLESINLTQPNVNNIDENNPNSIDEFINSNNNLRTQIGSAQNGIQARVNSYLSQTTALRSSESQLQNNDISKNIQDLNHEKIQINASILAQAHNVANLSSQIDRLLS